MIFDDFKNINLYNIDDEIKNFILNMNPEIEAGRHIINDKAFANVDLYETRPQNTLKLEAHKKHIDIQFLLKGSEKCFTTDFDGLEILEPYSKEKDVEFYKTPEDKKLNLLYLTKDKFVVLYPDDVHAPCIQYENTSEPVKKVIVKIEC